MKGITKVLTRCILAMAGIVVFMLLLNVGVLISWTAANMENSQPKKIVRAAAEGLAYQGDRFLAKRASKRGDLGHAGGPGGEGRLEI